MRRTIPTTPPDFDHTRVIERPDGFWWIDEAEGREYGPFASLVEAVDDMQAADDETVLDDADEAVRSVGEALGVPGWIDPDTGELADDEWTRTDEH
ncbi:MAG TPA: hypothetical protein VK047_07585 [Zeimonas sp.]|nr:hypothetical protein [Zeimonas sp.]